MKTDFDSARIFFGGLLAWFFARNLLTPLAFDDYCYAFVWSGAGNLVDGAPMSDRIDSLADIFDSQRNHYFTWGGRTIAHCLVQLFVSTDKIFFDIANTLAFGLLIVLIARLAEVRLSLKNLLWIALGLWLAVPQFVYGSLWLTGAINYLWMTVLQLFFLAVFLDRTKKISVRALELDRFKTIFLIPLGFLTGWSNEAGAIASIFVALRFSIEQKTFRSARSLGIVAALVGLAIMIFAPGNFVRTAHIFPEGFTLTTTVLTEHLNVWMSIIEGEVFLLLPILFAPKKKFAPFALAAWLIPTAMLFSPVFKDYAGFASPIFLLIASVNALDGFSLSDKIFKVVAAALSISMLIALAADFDFDRRVRDQLQSIEAQRGSSEIKLPPMERNETLETIFGARILNHYVGAEFGAHFMGLSVDPNFYYNRAVANYYGVSSVVSGAER